MTNIVVFLSQHFILHIQYLIGYLLMMQHFSRSAFDNLSPFISSLHSLMSIYLSMIMVLYSMGINTTHTSIYFQSTPMSRSSSIAISSIHCISQKHFHVFTQKAMEKEEQSVHKREYAIIE